MLTSEERKQLTDQYLEWTKLWGMSLGFAVTQSIEKSETAVADAIAALIAMEREQVRVQIEALSARAIRFARAIWETANREAFRGFGSEPFFRMPAVARAACVLKTRGQFSISQISETLGIRGSLVEDHLENARLLFSGGRSWLEASPGILVEGKQWRAECPQWVGAGAEGGLAGAAGGAADPQQTFARYVGNDLDPDTSHKLHEHIAVCSSCRRGFTRFKTQYLSWMNSIPTIEPDPALKRHLVKVTKMAMKVSRNGPPSPVPGLRRILREGQVRALLLGVASLWILQVLFFKRH